MLKSLKSVLLLATLSGILLLIGQAFGGQTGLTVALVIALAMNMGSWFFSDKIAVRAARAQPMPEADFPDVYAIVRALAQKAGKPEPSLYMSPSPQLNAFATGRNPDNAVVCVNMGLYRALDRDELEGVLAHELQHVYNRDILVGSIAASIAAAITFIARFAFFFGGSNDDEGANPFAQLALVFLAPVAAMLVQVAVTRSRESLADRTGAELTGKPLALASALRKLEAGAQSPQLARAGAVPAETNSAFAHLYTNAPLGGRRMFSKLFSTHPPIPERIEQLESMAREMGHVA